jgi:hypothetical protein
MTIVADAGPIISFARAGYDEVLRAVFPEIIIPEAVCAEIAFQGAGRPGASLVQQEEWIRVVAICRREGVDRLPKNLGLGEREAIALAEELNHSLLIDDRAGRKEAESRNMVYFGSLRVLKEAKDRGLLCEVTPIMDALRGAGLRMGEMLYQTFIREMGE